ncbi:hypothetical protein MSG28_012117 [Choristoneura fumiferana]|uniref:Uncharacterized protein n=1 Tax=Choristoneura fumiferana TaxID=7141 RepID=A0ACC0KCN3_CHOFU|nr:hypothetical protein MSG28_012117 [Choristoneura fumiferana]
MTSNSSYNNDKVVTGEVEYPATDPASGAFFQTDYKKNEDLKLMLDGSKDSLKLEAMKRIIGMIAKGRDASDLGVPRKRPQRAAPLDPDHRLLLRAAKPLLQSRNAGVVVAVAQLFYHAGPGRTTKTRKKK